MIEIYHVPGTRGVRPIWLCAELGIDYRVIDVDFSASYRSSLEWRAYESCGKSAGNGRYRVRRSYYFLNLEPWFSTCSTATVTVNCNPTRHTRSRHVSAVELVCRGDICQTTGRDC
jgi:hypothetical protein